MLERIANVGLRHYLKLFPHSMRFKQTCEVFIAQNQPENSHHFAVNGEEAFTKEHVTRCHVVFDVGANVGEWAQMALSANPSIELHCFEPSLSTYRRLEACDLPGNVVRNNLGLSSVAAEGELYIFGEEGGMNSLHQRRGLEPGYGIETPTQVERVQLETLDAYCQKHNVQTIDLLKIDTEGHDLQVVCGGTQMLQAGNIKRIQFEYGGTNIDSRVLLKDFFDLLLPLGFWVSRIMPKGLVPVPMYDQRLEDFKYKNFVALHSSLPQ